MKIYIAVADQSEARFYEVEHPAGPLKLTGKLADPKAHLHDRDFNSDRAGRMADGGPLAGGRQGASSHGTESERRPREHEARLFAQQIAAALEHTYRERGIERLILMAGPRFLGLLREELSAPVRALVAEEIHKDLVHAPEGVVLSHLPPAAFHTHPA